MTVAGVGWVTLSGPPVQAAACASEKTAKPKFAVARVAAHRMRGASHRPAEPLAEALFLPEGLNLD